MKKYLTMFKQTFTEFGEDKVPRLGAALAYYTIFSLAPLLLIAIAIAGLTFGREAAQGEIFGQLRGVLGANSAKMVQEMVTNAAKPKQGTLAAIFGVVTLILGASGVFGQLKDALNTIWDVPKKEGGGILGLIKARFLSAAMVFGVGFLLLVSLVIDSAISALGKFAGNRLPGGETLWLVLQNIVALAVVTVLFAMLFRFLPDLKIEWRDVWLGAALTSVLFVIGKFALGIYFGKSAVGSSYGAAGSLVLVLLWVYYSAQILLFGAEFTQVYARSHGSLKKEAEREANRAREARPERPTVTPAIAYKTVPATGGGGGGAAKLAVGGAAGLLLGALVGGVGAFVVLVKSVKKFFS
jgi:membrane protein